MSNQVKFMSNTMAGAPVLSNGWGDMTAMLDACLVNGFNLKTAASVARSGDVATMTFATAHGFEAGQVLLVAGATPTAYNGEVIVTGVTTLTLTYAVAGTPSTPPTGTITAKVAPLGFEIAFTGTNKRAYRSPNTAGPRNFLRVDDSNLSPWTSTYAKFARVTIAEGMSDIDTFVGARAPFDPLAPTKNEIPTGSGTTAYGGWYKWYYARQSYNESAGDGGASAKDWCLIGDDRGFYLINSCFWSSGQRIVHGFNEFESFKTADPYRTVLLASERYKTAADTSSAYPADDNAIGNSASVVGRVMMRSFTGVGGTVAPMWVTLNDVNNTNNSGYSSGFAYPNGPDYGLIIHPIYMREGAVGGHLRGVMQGMLWVHQNQPVPHLTILDNVIGYTGKKFIYLTFGLNIVGGNVSGFMFDLSGPWR